MSTQTQTGDFLPSEFISRIMRWWWLIAVFMLAGGLGGYLISLVRAPLYESTAQITTAIDYAYAGRLTDYEEDHLITAIGDVIDSSAVMDVVAETLIARGLSADPVELSSHLTLSRQGYRWQLSSRYSDPQLARAVAQVWTQSALDALGKMKLDALQGLQEYLLQEAVETCFSQSVALDPVATTCSLDELDTIQKTIAESGSVDTDSLLNSLRLSSTSYELTQAASLPGAPVRYKVNSLVLTGILIGLLAGVLFFLAGFPKRRSQG